MEAKTKCNVVSCFIASFIASFVAIFLAYLIKPCILDNCCGVVCCLIALILIVAVICFINNNKSKCINHPIVIGMSAISLTIAVTTAIYLCCKGGCCSISNINYGDTSIAVLSVIVGLLIGWNIYSVIDTKSEVDKLKEERSKLQEYVKANRNYAIGVTNLTNQKYGTAIGFLCSAAVKANKISDREMYNVFDQHFSQSPSERFVRHVISFHFSLLFEC